MGKSEGLLECASSFQILHVLNIFLAKELAGFANRCRAGSVVSMILASFSCLRWERVIADSFSNVTLLTLRLH